MKYLDRFAAREAGAGIPPTHYRKEPSKPSKAAPASLPAAPVLSGPWDAQAAGEVLSAALSRIAELCPAGCGLDTPAMREAIEQVDAAFEAGDGKTFAFLLAALGKTAVETVAAWRGSRGQHSMARKIHSEILDCDLWVVDEPGYVPAGRKADEAVYDAQEIALLQDLKDRGALTTIYLKALHAAKTTFPGVRLMPENAEPTARKEEARAVRIRNPRTKQEVVIVSTVLESWLKDGWELIPPGNGSRGWLRFNDPGPA